MAPHPLLAAFALVALAACAPAQQDRADFDPHERFRNTVEKREAVAVVTAGPDAALGATDRAVIADLAREHLRRGAGMVAVAVAFGGDEAPARAFAGRIKAALDEAGVEAVALSMAPQPGAGAISARIGVPVWVARVPECGAWDRPLNPDYHNQNTDNLGCAITRNIGLMVSNPADLERARDATGRSGVRSADVLGKYGEGKATASKAEDSKPAATLSAVGAK